MAGILTGTPHNLDKQKGVYNIINLVKTVPVTQFVQNLGPEGGQGGEHLVDKGTPEEVSKNSDSHTGYYLKRVLKRKAPR
jgi:excinuclease ABC subunit A